MPDRTAVIDDLRVLTGAPGSGKTAILDELRRRGIRCVDEPARRVLKEQRATGGTGTPEVDATRFVELLLELAIADHRDALTAGGPVLFDRGISDCVAYASHLGVDPAPSRAASERHRYHAEVLIVEPWEEIYVTDDERVMSFSQTVTFHAAIEDAYDRTGYRRVQVPRGTVADRAAFVMRQLAG